MKEGGVVGSGTIGLAVVIAILGVSPASNAQGVILRSGEPSRSQQSIKAVQVPSPDWLVWYSFYVGINSQIQSPAGEVHKMLTDKLGVDGRRTNGKMINRFFSLGEAYVQEVSRLLETEKAEVGKRSVAALVSTGSAPPHMNINEVLERDGSTARFEASKNAALAEHRQQLMELIGSEGVESMVRWLDTEVRNQIRVFKLDVGSSHAAAQ